MLVLDEDQVLNSKDPLFTDENEDGFYDLRYKNESDQEEATFFIEQFMI